jgi:hypothetical protein
MPLSSTKTTIVVKRPPSPSDTHDASRQVQGELRLPIPVDRWANRQWEAADGKPIGCTIDGDALGCKYFQGQEFWSEKPLTTGC